MKKLRAQKSKAEILSMMKSNVDFQRKMGFIKEKFWPALIEASTSVDDASILLTGWNSILMEQFLDFMKEKKFKDLNLYAKLDAKSDKFLQFQKLLELFDDMSVFEAKDYIEGMRSELELFKNEEWKSRPLSSLVPKWMDDYLKENA